MIFAGTKFDSTVRINMGFVCLSGCVWQPSFSGVYSFWIHCAAREQEGPFPQMVRADEQLKLEHDAK